MIRSLPKLFIHITVAILVLAGAAVAIASRSQTDPPPAKPLAEALGDALAAPAPQGISGRIEFSNRLVETAATPHGVGSPLLAGAGGRFWVDGEGRARLELQSHAGDAQVQLDNERITVYEPASNTLYSAAVEHGGRHGRDAAALPGGAQIQVALQRLARGVTLSEAKPGTIAGRPAYTVRVAPRHDGGLLGAAELAWDAGRGVPLRAAVYAQGKDEPVLELEVTDIDFGPVDDADVAPPRPAGAKVVEIGSTGAGASAGGQGAMGAASGMRDVQERLSFDLSAPESVAGLPRRSVRTLRSGGETGAVVTYGEGLGGILVVQLPASADDPVRGSEAAGLQQLSIDGTTAFELATALGTMIQFERDGVSYTIVGSVPPAAAEAAARAL